MRALIYFVTPAAVEILLLALLANEYLPLPWIAAH